MVNYLTAPNTVALLIAILALVVTKIEGVRWSCAQNATKTPLNMEKVAGLWYEVARIPKGDVPACTKIIAPSVFENDNYTLQLDYVNNVNKGWKPTKENLTFPLDTVKKNGTFELILNEDQVTLVFNFQYMFTLENITLVCGYSRIAPGISLFYILSRNETVDPRIIDTVDKLLVQQGIDPSEITWVEQGGRCNGASYLPSPTLALVLAVGMLLALFADVKPYQG